VAIVDQARVRRPGADDGLAGRQRRETGDGEAETQNLQPGAGVLHVLLAEEGRAPGELGEPVRAGLLAPGVRLLPLVVAPRERGDERADDQPAGHRTQERLDLTPEESASQHAWLVEQSRCRCRRAPKNRRVPARHA
jgi:hypothetical protein